jgi:excisionase family DNA binding protein
MRANVIRMVDNGLTTPQAAKQFGVPERTLQAAIKRDELPATRIDVRGGAYLIKAADAAAFAEKWKQRRDQRRQAATNGEQEIRNHD